MIPTKPTLMVADWVKPVPDYIRWLHRVGIMERAADEYTDGHIVAFHVREGDVKICPDLLGIEMVYLVFPRRDCVL